VPIGRKALEDSTKSYVRAIRRVAAGDPVLKAEGGKLYQALIAPVATEIADSKTLVLIPSGRLNSLPFGALEAPSGEPLGVSKQLLELAKSTDLMRIPNGKPAPIDSVVAFANATGDLPAAGREGEQIAALFPKSKLFEGKEATKDAFVKFGGQAQALHLATHGEWNVENSLDNYLAMADQEKVAQDEIFQLSLDNTSIVILSACNTAMGDGGDVQYVASLAEAFWIAGSRSVVASLWAVNDESTSLLMTELYKSLRAGDGKAEALRKAQAAVRANPRFAHPYYWSGFILFGDWR
jgi:CHAT domain-containing protein